MGNFIYNTLGSVGFTDPLHPILTHLVIGPVIAALLIALFAWIFNKPAGFRTARHLTVFSFVMWFFTVAMGFLDWKHFQSGQLIHAIIMKFILASVLFLILLATILVNRRLPLESKIPIIFYALSTACVLALGYYGGSLVYG